MSQHSSRTSEYKRNRLLVLERDPFCMYGCGRESVEADHLIPKSQGGTDALSNLVGSCKQCNNAKGDKVLVRVSYSNAKWEV